MSLFRIAVCVKLDEPVTGFTVQTRGSSGFVQSNTYECDVSVDVVESVGELIDGAPKFDTMQAQLPGATDTLPLQETVRLVAPP